MRIASVGSSLGHGDLDGVGRLFLRNGGEEEKPADDEQEDEDQYNQSRHAGAFAERGSRCIAPRVIEFGKRLDRPLVLVGLMGVGKSTVGRRLARRLGLSFVDSDAAIEDAAGLSPAEVFERYGEQDFRDGERRLVARLVDEGSVRVIATGGGAFVDPRTRELLNERAITIWLDAPVDILTERTGRRDTRAQLRIGDRRATLEQLLNERRSAYEQAHIHVKSGDGAHKDVVDAILRALHDFLKD
jgi:shikimate kinase